MSFTDGPIEGVVIRELARHLDDRGWLAELFRSDELAETFHPAMGYVSVSRRGVLRGPHEHREQADLFCWVGPGDFEVLLWDDRPASPTRGHRLTLLAGAARPAAVIIPAGVVHAYRCLGPEEGWALNFPNRLYAGPGRGGAVDEIRHEDDPESPFVIDERERRR